MARGLLAHPQHRHHDRGGRASCFADRGPRVITNNLNVAAIFTDNPDREAIVAGGVVRLRDRGIVGEATVDFIRVCCRHRADRHSASRPTAPLRDYDFREVKVSRAIIEHARQVWLC